MAVEIMTARDTIRIVVRHGPAARPTGLPLAAILDIGEAGRLLGVEMALGEHAALGAPRAGSSGAPDQLHFDETANLLYVPVVPATGGLVRSASVTLLAFAGDDGGLTAIEIPRRGHGYEVAYPSGNQ